MVDKFFGLAGELLDRGLAQTVESYDANNTYDTAIKFTEDLDFHLQLSRAQGGQVLDIGCGTARVAKHLLEHGIDVVGMDLSPHMLALAKSKLSEAGLSAELVQGDMRDFNLPYTFDLIIIPYYSMIYMRTDDERRQVFDCVYGHLREGGVFAFDFDAGVCEPGTTKPWLGFQEVNRSTGEVLVQTVQMHCPNESLRIVDIITYRYRGSESCVQVCASVEATCGADRMRQLLQAAGFEVLGLYADYNHTPYGGGEECIAVARKS